MTVYLGDKAVGVNTIVEKGVAKTKFGASVDMLIGDVDANGVLQAPTTQTALNFTGVTEIGIKALSNAFDGFTGIISVDLSSVQSIAASGLSNAFDGCTGITSVDFSSLQSIGNIGLYYAFRACTGITKISFPSLTSVQTNSLQNAFGGCTALTEIHFRADMQATIEALSGYSNKFGATNATIYFDL